MFRVCMFYTKNNEEALEALNNGFLRVFTKIEQYKGDGDLGAWIRRVIVNTTLNYLKANKQVIIEEITENTIAISGDESYNPMAALNKQQLLTLVAKLPEATKVVFNLYAVEGYNHKEIGTLLGISENTSKWHYAEARKKLQVFITQYDSR